MADKDEKDHIAYSAPSQFVPILGLNIVFFLGQSKLHVPGKSKCVVFINWKLLSMSMIVIC